ISKPPKSRFKEIGERLVVTYPDDPVDHKALITTAIIGRKGRTVVSSKFVVIVGRPSANQIQYVQMTRQAERSVTLFGICWTRPFPWKNLTFALEARRKDA